MKKLARKCGQFFFEEIIRPPGARQPVENRLLPH
jgi:hypothetical protein